MFKKTLLLILFLLCVLAFSPQRTFTATSPITGHKIILDAGHGGTDYGSIACPDLPEKTATLDVAYRLKSLLEADTASVVMTRSDDSTLSNNDRYTTANNSGGEVLVSIHLNGSSNPSTDGTQGLYGKIGKDKSFTQVMHDALWNGLKSTPNFIDFGVTNFASGVLLKSIMPATIQETVFISDTDECAWLKDGTGNRQQEIAQQLYNGLVDWFGQPQPTPTSKPGKHK